MTEPEVQQFAESVAAQAEMIARQFHFSYEMLAPSFGYKTRPESAVQWDDVPDANRALMVKVASYLLISGLIMAGPSMPQFDGSDHVDS